MNKNKLQYNKGAAMMMLVFFFVFISFTVLIGIVAPAVREFRIASDIFNSKSTYFLAESGVEDMLYRVKNNKLFDNSETLVLGNNSTTTVVSTIDSDHKSIISNGTTNSIQRELSVVIQKGTGVSFNYGLQVGAGGLYLDDGRISGNVFSGGDITASNNAYNEITGSAIVVNTDSLSVDTSNGSVGSPPYSVVFGSNSSNQDLAQSFTISNSVPLNKIQFYIKKNGLPPDANVYIANNNNGSPSNSILTSGTLLSSLVSNSYGFVDVVFNNNILLNTNTTYWIVVDMPSVSSSKYYTVGANNNTYTQGNAKIGTYSSTSWNSLSPTTLDTYFKVFLGGLSSKIEGYSSSRKLKIGSSSSDVTQAVNVNNVNASGVLYCTNGSGNNKSCNTSIPNTSSETWPISDSNIQAWKDEAEAGTITNGNVSISAGTSTFGPRKIVGNLSVSNFAQVYLTGTLWITGNLTLSDLSILRLSSSYGSKSGVIIVDGIITISDFAYSAGSGVSGSNLVLISLSDCPIGPSCGYNNAINMDTISFVDVLVAQNGTAKISNWGLLKSIIGYRVELNHVIVNYNTGLENLNFSSGPSGSWDVSGWQETQ